MMMGWTQGRQYSGREIGDQLRDVGPAQVLRRSAISAS